MHPIENTLNGLLSALDTKDAGAVARLLVEDAMLADEVTGGWLRGRDAIRTSLENAFTTVDSLTSSVRDLSSRPTGSSTIVTCTLEQTYVMDGTPVSIVAPTTFVLEADEGAWQVVLMHSIPLPAQ